MILLPSRTFTRRHNSGNGIELYTYDVPGEGLELPGWWFWEMSLPVVRKSNSYLHKPCPLKQLKLGGTTCLTLLV